MVWGLKRSGIHLLVNWLFANLGASVKEELTTTEMFVSAFVLGISKLNPDLILTYVDRERLQIVAFVIETTSAFQIEAATVPVAG